MDCHGSPLAHVQKQRLTRGRAAHIDSYQPHSCTSVHQLSFCVAVMVDRKFIELGDIFKNAVSMVTSPAHQ